MLNLKKTTTSKESGRKCGSFDANCMLCDGGWYDINKGAER